MTHLYAADTLPVLGKPVPGKYLQNTQKVDGKQIDGHIHIRLQTKHNLI